MKEFHPRTQRRALCAPSAVVLGVASACANAQTTWVVDRDGHASAASCEAATPAFVSIQAAVDAAAAGDTVLVCPGTYREQVVVRTSHLAIRGAGAGVTVLKPTTVLPSTVSLVLGTPVSPIVLVDAAADVTITHLTVDGSAADSGAVLRADCSVMPFYSGIYYRAASGTVSDTNVTGIRSATACADAVRAEDSELTLAKSWVDRYGRTGIACAGTNSRCTITGNVITGLGPVDNQTQSGVRIGSAAAAAVAGNVISDHVLIGAHGVAQVSIGILLTHAAPNSHPHLLSENVLFNNQLDVQRAGSAAQP